MCYRGDYSVEHNSCVYVRERKREKERGGDSARERKRARDEERKK